MPTKTFHAGNRLRDFLKEYPELGENDRQLVRQILCEATFLELARLLADPEMQRGLEAVREDQRRARKLTFSDPAPVAFALLGLIAIVAAACALLRW